MMELCPTAVVSDIDRRIRDGQIRETEMRKGTAATLAAAVVFGGAFFHTRGMSQRAEQRYPPVGQFVVANGITLHFVEQGAGPPVVLLHGEGGLLQEFTETLVPALQRHHRVLAFDRPGYGYSSPSRTMARSPMDQARLFQAALRQLGVRRPIVVGHSWGALVAIAYALAYSEDVAGIALLSGFFYPGGRLLPHLAGIGAAPLIGPLLRHTLGPPLFQLMAPLNWQAQFAPRPVPRSMENFPFALTARPEHLRTNATEGWLLPHYARVLGHGYAKLACPVAIIAGHGDAVVSTAAQSERLHRDIPQARLTVVKRGGHMPHYADPQEVASAIEAIRHTAN